MTLLEFMNVLNTRGIGLQARDGKLNRDGAEGGRDSGYQV